MLYTEVKKLTKGLGMSLNNLPNILTIMRITLIPLFMLAFYMPFSWRYPVATTIFVFAAVTDWLDGYLARKLRQESSFGEFLDPVADKLIVAVALVLLVGSYHSPLIAVPAAIIVGREIVISALREWMAELGQRAQVSVSYLGKIKTTAQMVAIILLLAQPPGLVNDIQYIGFGCLYVAAILTIWTMMLYVKSAWHNLTQGKG